MFSSVTKCYRLGEMYFIIWDAMLLSGANVIIWKEMLSSGANVLIWSLCYHLELHNVIIWYYHVMLSYGMITSPFLFFLKTSLTQKNCQNKEKIYAH
jgi:hypothetical protein